MSSLSKVGVIVLFLSLLVLILQFVGLSEVSSEENGYRRILAVKFGVKTSSTFISTTSHQEILNNLNDVVFLVEGRLMAQSVGKEFDLVSTYTGNDRYVSDEPLFNIKSESEVYEIKEFPNGYIIHVLVPQYLRYMDLSIEYNYDKLRSHLYKATKTEGFIMSDMVSKDIDGLTLTAIRNVEPPPTIHLRSKYALIFLVVFSVIGIIMIFWGVILGKHSARTVEDDLDIYTKRELNIPISGLDKEFDNSVYDKFSSINKKPRRIFRLGKNSDKAGVSKIVNLSNDACE